MRGLLTHHGPVPLYPFGNSGHRTTRHVAERELWNMLASTRHGRQNAPRNRSHLRHNRSASRYVIDIVGSESRIMAIMENEDACSPKVLRAYGECAETCSILADARRIAGRSALESLFLAEKSMGSHLRTPPRGRNGSPRPGAERRWRHTPRHSPTIQNAPVSRSGAPYSAIAALAATADRLNLDPSQRASQRVLGPCVILPQKGQQ